MSEMIKNKIKTANDPTVHNRRSFITIAKVIKTSEQNNYCSIEYVNNFGVHCIQKKVPVLTSSISIIDWFPKKNDIVNVEVNEGNILIVGPYDANYNVNRSQVQNKKDFLSNDYGDTMCGVLF